MEKIVSGVAATHCDKEIGKCVKSVCDCSTIDGDKNEKGGNFLVLMTEMAGVVGRFRERIVNEGKTFAKDFATLAPYMEGLSGTQEQIFLSAFAAAMDEANSHMQKVVGATFEAL